MANLEQPVRNRVPVREQLVVARQAEVERAADPEQRAGGLGAAGAVCRGQAQVEGEGSRLGAEVGGFAVRQLGRREIALAHLHDPEVVVRGRELGVLRERIVVPRGCGRGHGGQDHDFFGDHADSGQRRGQPPLSAHGRQPHAGDEHPRQWVDQTEFAQIWGNYPGAKEQWDHRQRPPLLGDQLARGQPG